MRPRLSDGDLARFEAAVAKMTPGPWKAHAPTYNKRSLNSYRNAITSAVGVVAIAFTRGFRYRCYEMPTEPCADAEGIALLRNHADDIFAELKEAREHRRILREALKRQEWCGFDDTDQENYCPVCGCGKDTGAHTTDCIVGKALAATTEGNPE